MYTPADMYEINNNFIRVNSLVRRLFLALARKDYRNPAAEGPGSPYYVRMVLAQMMGAMSNPFKPMQSQLQIMSNTTSLASDLYDLMLSGGFASGKSSGEHFQDEDWRRHPIFIALKHQYKYICDALDDAAEAAGVEDEKHAPQFVFFADQMKAMLSPENFLATNPEALKKMIETKGQSIVDGLQNFVEDLERADGDLLVALADPGAFKVGRDLATTPGHVVYETSLYQLIRYHPKTEKVYSRPLLIIPPWINKFYIMDLQAKNSMILWLVEQGFTVYVVSWKNPDPSMRDTGFDDYVLSGVVNAVEKVRELTEQETINVVGYCIGGTAVASATAWYAKQDKPNPIRSTTFFTCLVDFEDPGMVKVFLDESFIVGIMMELHRKGILDKRIMSRTFSYLRPADLVYGPAIHSYLLGEERPKFDLLYWNGDSTNLPAKMARQYLLRLYRDNEFVEGKFDIDGEPVRLDDINVAHYVVAGETDHIAPWRTSFQGMSNLKGKGRFILARSGHIAGVINHPSKKKYGYFSNDEVPVNADRWLAEAELHEGSWWPDWAIWLGRRSGRKVDAEVEWPEHIDTIEPAPGRYVLE